VLTEVDSTILGASWGAQGTIVFSQARELYKVNEKGGTPERLYKPDSGIHFDPEFLPDGNHVLWMNNGVFLGSLEGEAVPIMRGSVVNNRNLLHQPLSAACRGALPYIE
jgi:hypothetical protein